MAKYHNVNTVDRHYLTRGQRLMNEKANNKNKELSWTAIIIITIFFWPAGVYLIYKRLSKDKKAFMTSGKTITKCGYASLALCFLGMFVCIGEGFKKEDMQAIIFFMVAGIALIILGKSTTKKSEKNKKYISIIINEKQTSIDNIAVQIPTSYEEAYKDISNMINKGYLGQAYINDKEREVMFLKETLYNEENTQNQENVSIKTKSVICKNCGAQNKIIIGKASNCEYCDSQLEG